MNVFEDVKELRKIADNQRDEIIRLQFHANELEHRIAVLEAKNLILEEIVNRNKLLGRLK